MLGDLFYAISIQAWDKQDIALFHFLAYTWAGNLTVLGFSIGLVVVVFNIYYHAYFA